MVLTIVLGNQGSSALLSRMFFAGFVRLHILYHAAEEPICGVEVVAELGRHGYRLSPGTLYPVLHQLEQAGYLTTRAKVVAGKQRKYYEATAAGRKALEEAKVKLRELAWCHPLTHQGGTALLTKWHGRARPRGEPAVGEARAAAVGYWEKNEHRTDYPRYWAHGGEIGSGPVDSTCKTVVGQRLK